MVINTAELPREPIEHTYGNKGLSPSSLSDIDRVRETRLETASLPATELKVATSAVLQVLREKR